MKKQLFTLCTLLTFSIIAWADAPRYTPGDSLYKAGAVTNNTTDGEVDLYIYFHNYTDTAQEVYWKFVEDTMPVGWQVGLCDNNACFYNENNALYTQRRSNLIPAGDSMFLKMVFNPFCVSGSALIKVYVHIVGDFAKPDTLTYKTDIDASNCTIMGISELEKTTSITTFPNPANNHVFVKGLPLNSNYKLDIMDVQGRILTGSIYSQGKDKVSLDASSLVPGLYLVRITDTENNFVRVSTFSKQ